MNVFYQYENGAVSKRSTSSDVAPQTPGGATEISEIEYNAAVKAASDGDSKAEESQAAEDRGQVEDRQKLILSAYEKHKKIAGQGQNTYTEEEWMAMHG